MADDSSPKARAIAALTELFLEKTEACSDFSVLESICMDAGHECMSVSLGRALEARDEELMRSRPEGYVAHDKRTRTLATEMGDVSFVQRRYRDRFGLDAYLLSDRYGIPYGARVSPGAAEFLVLAASQASYAKAADLLARHGSRVSERTVMAALRRAGDACEREDVAAAKSLYGDGVVPEAESRLNEICMEADGTWFSVQRPKPGEPRRFEVKAMCAYGGKEVRGGKVRRTRVFHHACVGAPDEFWSEGVAQMGAVFDLGGIETVHLGADGEPWCSDAGRYLPGARVAVQLDPYHVNRAILSCSRTPGLARRLIGVASDGDAASAAALLGAAASLGLANEGAAKRVAGYLLNNSELIGAEGPSLGTIESDNQHIYGARMDSVPCAWSVRGGSDMARILSRRASGREIPRVSRLESMPHRKRDARNGKVLAKLERGGAGRVVESVGEGYLPPHQVDTSGIEAGKAYALYRAMSNMDAGI